MKFEARASLTNVKHSSSGTFVPGDTTDLPSKGNCYGTHPADRCNRPPHGRTATMESLTQLGLRPERRSGTFAGGFAGSDLHGSYPARFLTAQWLDLRNAFSVASSATCCEGVEP